MLPLQIPPKKLLCGLSIKPKKGEYNKILLNCIPLHALCEIFYRLFYVLSMKHMAKINVCKYGMAWIVQTKEIRNREKNLILHFSFEKKLFSIFSINIFFVYVWKSALPFNFIHMQDINLGLLYTHIHVEHKQSRTPKKILFLCVYTHTYINIIHMCIYIYIYLKLLVTSYTYSIMFTIFFTPDK